MVGPLPALQRADSRRVDSDAPHADMLATELFFVLQRSSRIRLMAGLATRTASPLLKVPVANATTVACLTLALVVGWCEPRYPKRVMNIAIAHRSVVDNPLTKGFKPVALNRGIDKVVRPYVANRTAPAMNPRPVAEDAHRLANRQFS